MTEPKRNNTSHNHTTAKPASKLGQSFDIIPRSQVRPTVTARPVLTPTKPEQADNTLQTTTQAATSQLKHGTLSFTPSAPELDENDTESLLDQVASISAEVGNHKKPAPAEANEVNGTEEVEAAKAIEDDVTGKDAKNGPEYSTDGILDKDPIVEPAEPGLTTPPEDDEKDKDAMAGPVADETPEAPDTMPGSKDPADGSIDHIFKDADQQSIEHSQALKDELQTIDDKPEENVHPHHELYGGKPVIVIHKAHSAQATLNVILWFIFCLLLALVIVDVLLDSGTITTDYNIPHTRWL